MDKEDFASAIAEVSSLINQAAVKLEALRLRCIARPTPAGQFPMPTLEQARDPKAKFGVNLTAIGLEMLYRIFDHGHGLRTASKMLDISTRAAKYRRSCWEKAGGISRPKSRLDFDPA